MLLQALIGVAIAVPLLALSRDHDRSRRLWSFALVVATLIYVGFAIAAGESIRWSDVKMDETAQAVRVRREMERVFAPPGHLAERGESAAAAID